MLQTDSITQNIIVPASKAAVTNVVVQPPLQPLVKIQPKVIDSISVVNVDTNYLNNYKLVSWKELLSYKNTVHAVHANKKIFTHAVSDSSSVFPKKESASNHSILYGYGINNFFIVLIFVAVVLLAWCKVAFEKYLVQTFRAVINYSDAYKLYRDHNTLLDRFYFLLNIIFVISGGIFSFHVFKLLKSSAYSNYSLYILYSGFTLIIAIFITRFLITKVLAGLLDQFQSFNEYLHSTFLYLKVTGIFLLPLVAVISFVSTPFRPVLLYFGLIVILIFYLVSIFRGSRIMLQKGVLLFYWILYLCTVEFLPIMLLYKLFNSLV